MKEKEPSSFMRQYNDVKRKNPGTIIFFRMGDFYEMFNEDAITVSQALDLALTSKNCGLDEKAPMCGVPYHSASMYISKLMQAGYKVAICEQTTTPKAGVKLLDREVVKIVTPGTVTELELLEDKKNNFLMGIYGSADKVAVAYVDITTGEFSVTQITENFESELTDIVTRIAPSEVIANKEGKKLYDGLAVLKLGTLPKAFEYYSWAFTDARADENLSKQFGQNYATVYELAGKKDMIYVCGAILEYINETQKRLVKNITRLSIIHNSEFLVIDMNTRRNLELVETIRERKKQGSLLNLIDRTKTNMGARRLRKYFDQPLQDDKKINARLDAVEEIVKKIRLRDQLAQVLGGIKDIERLAGKVGYGNVNPLDVRSLKNSLQDIPTIKNLLADAQSTLLKSCQEQLVDFSDLCNLIESAIVEQPPIILKEGGYIKKGFNKQLDEYRAALDHGTEWIRQLEAKEREETGIKNLRIASNKVFGYYIEVNKSQSELVPLRYQRKQTISNNERYITEDLKILEDKIYGARDNAIELEQMLFDQIRDLLSGYVNDLQQTASAIAEIDTMLSFAEVAVKNNYSRPLINKKLDHLKIVEGRHPVVEAFSKSASFIPNDTYLDGQNDRIMVITGPNMAGKSTYMRQVAVITFLAHIGCFVPAKSAEIPITDRIFTRVGASDDLVFGQSTFMVEMSEVATILKNATDKSLIILDEIGRGTSTFDGLSIAWSVVEFLAKNFKAKTLFATHYHELTDLEGIIDGVKNYKIAVKELDDEVVFLRKIMRGGANKSFGIEVARLAGVPSDVLARAKEISHNLERQSIKFDAEIFKENKDKAASSNKKALEILNRLKDTDINTISPLHAFDMLNDLVNYAKQGEDK